MTSQEDITNATAAIAVPTLVISGEEDRVDPPSILKRELLPRLPRSTLHLLTVVGHLSPLEAPRAIAGLIRSIATQVPSDGLFHSEDL